MKTSLTALVRPVVLTASAIAFLGCPGDDDDDDTVLIDDDDTADEVVFDPCEGDPEALDEVEPNGELPGQIIDADGDLVIRGSCATASNDGAAWTGDVDVFTVRAGCGGEATFTLDWDPGAGLDADVRVTAEAVDPNGFIWHGFTPSTREAETGTAEAAGDLEIEVLCWDGPDDVAWTLTIDWATAPDFVPGDDDDAADDDDAVDDDDSAVGDDDDSAAGDDDDSAGAGG